MLVLPSFNGVSNMQTPISKLTRKYQATIPEPVRRSLGLEAGYSIAFDIQANGIHLRKAAPIDLVFAAALEGTLSEWSSRADDEAYRDL